MLRLLLNLFRRPPIRMGRVDNARIAIEHDHSCTHRVNRGFNLSSAFDEFVHPQLQRFRHCVQCRILALDKHTHSGSIIMRVRHAESWSR